MASPERERVVWAVVLIALGIAQLARRGK